MSDSNILEANEIFEQRKAADSSVTMAMIEVELGLPKGKLRNWRANRGKLASLRQSVPAVIPAKGALVIPGPGAAASDAEVQEWDLDDISMHGNIRTEFGLEELQSLANSLRSTTLLQFPLGYIGEKDGKPHLFLYVGERRFRAHELRRDRGEDVRTMKVRVTAKPSQKQFLQMNFVENHQRVDLRPSEEAAGIKMMLDLVDEETGLAPFSIRTCAEELGMRYQAVQDAINSLGAPAKARKALDEGRVAFDVVGMIGSLPESMREEAVDAIIFGVGGVMRQAEARAFIHVVAERSPLRVEWGNRPGLALDVLSFLFPPEDLVLLFKRKWSQGDFGVWKNTGSFAGSSQTAKRNITAADRVAALEEAIQILTANPNATRKSPGGLIIPRIHR